MHRKREPAVSIRDIHVRRNPMHRIVVRFEDARMVGTFVQYQPDHRDPLFPLYSPQPHHLPYYFSDPDPAPCRMEKGHRVYQGTTMEGRKVYVHHDPMHRVAANVYIANRNCRFSFTVHFENLSPPELGLLLFALDLKRAGGPSHLRHHYGYGKPAGYGCMRMNANECWLERRGWYRGFDEPATWLPAHKDPRKNVEGFKRMFFEKRRPEGPDWVAFERWMVYPRPGEVRYPTLEEIQGGEE